MKSYNVKKDNYFVQSDALIVCLDYQFWRKKCKVNVMHLHFIQLLFTGGISVTLNDH
jgi:hypothetical protein